MPVTSLHHYLRPLVTPSSVALVGASERSGSLGRIVLENILGSPFDGEFFAVNPAHRKVLGRKSHASLAAIGKPVDLAVIVSPPLTMRETLQDAARARVPAAIVLTDPGASDPVAQRRWIRDVGQLAARRGIRLVGPGAFGIVRTDIGLNASVSDAPVAPGRLALVAQSGAVCAAMLDFAAPMGIGFSTAISLGAGVDINFGEMLDCLLIDPATDGILLYVESVRDARRFLSALRAAARTKPVILLKAGRSTEAIDPHSRVPAQDAVFDAAVRRAGTVRVRTYTQLFAAARILAAGRIPRGERIAIVANGRGPALLAADCAVERGVKLAELERPTVRALDAVLPQECARSNPVDVRGDASPARFAAAVAATLADPGVNAVIALHVPRPGFGATDVARAVAGVTRGADKPVLGAWLGAIDRPEAREALEAGGIANFFTPENAVEAFSFLAAYRRHQEWLLEVPSPQPEPGQPDFAAAEAVRAAAERDGRTELSETQAMRLLEAYGLAALPRATVYDVDEAKRTARGMVYPVSLAIDASTLPPRSAIAGRRERLRDARAVARAFAELAALVDARYRADWRVGIEVRKEPGLEASRELVLGVYTDPVFGPVIALGPGRGRALPVDERTLMLPPLNRRLAGDMIDALHARGHADEFVAGDAREAMLRLLLAVSTLVCALPWLVELELDPLIVAPAGALVTGARVVVDHRRARMPRYGHMAIHPYPVELVEDATARDGSLVHLRPIRPEDAEMERDFVNALSERSRYLRFFYRMHELTPAMLARFTQVDYDREMAFVAIVDDDAAPHGRRIVGVARFVQSPDRESAEYAIVVADEWQGRGVGGLLMRRLIDVARRKGLAQLEGAVLRENVDMARFVQALGFTLSDDPHDSEQVLTTLDLKAHPRAAA
jgi:acetyltransferase